MTFFINIAVDTRCLLGSMKQIALTRHAFSTVITSTATRTLFPDVEETGHQNIYLVKYRGSKKHDYGNKKFAYLNGAGNSLQDAISNTKTIVITTQSDVFLGYIPTITVIQDLFEAVFERHHLLSVPQSHVEICKNLCIKGTSDGSELILMPHSRALHAVREVNKRYGKTFNHVLQNTRVYAIAGSSEIPSQHNFKEVVNTVCFSDYFVRFLNNGAIHRQRQNGMLREIVLQEKDVPSLCSGHTFQSPTIKHSIERYAEELRRKS